MDILQIVYWNKRLIAISSDMLYNLSKDQNDINSILDQLDEKDINLREEISSKFSKIPCIKFENYAQMNNGSFVTKKIIDYLSDNGHIYSADMNVQINLVIQFQTNCGKSRHFEHALAWIKLSTKEGSIVFQDFKTGQSSELPQYIKDKILSKEPAKHVCNYQYPPHYFIIFCLLHIFRFFYTFCVHQKLSSKMHIIIMVLIQMEVLIIQI